MRPMPFILWCFALAVTLSERLPHLLVFPPQSANFAASAHEVSGVVDSLVGWFFVAVAWGLFFGCCHLLREPTDRDAFRLSPLQAWASTLAVVVVLALMVTVAYFTMELCGIHYGMTTVR